MADPCDICGGERRIKLPILRPVTVEGRPEMQVEIIAPSMRVYPCPECSQEWAPAERVQVITSHVEVSLPSETIQGAREAVIRSAVFRLADGLIKGDFLKVQEHDRAGWYGTQVDKVVRVSVGVVSRKTTVSLMQRVLERATELVDRARDLAMVEIANWGSHYCVTEIISKAEARRLILAGHKQALAEAKERGE